MNCRTKTKLNIIKKIDNIFWKRCLKDYFEQIKMACLEYAGSKQVMFKSEDANIRFLLPVSGEWEKGENFCAVSFFSEYSVSQEGWHNIVANPDNFKLWFKGNGECRKSYYKVKFSRIGWTTINL